MLVCPKCSKQGHEGGKLCRACGAILEQVEDVSAVADLDDAAGFAAHAPSTKVARPTEAAKPPLGLPSGSVRAILTFLIVAVVITQIVRGQQVELLWAETLMIALAHYFTTRRLLNLSPDLIRRLTDEGHIQQESRPLYLPRHSVRVILVGSFIGLGWYLYEHNRLMEPQSLSILGVVFAYFLGMIVRLKKVSGWEDLKAAVVVLALLGTAASNFINQADQLPACVQHITLGMVLFYFGSR